LIHNTTEIGLFFAVGALHNEKCCGTLITKAGMPSAQGCRIAIPSETAEINCDETTSKNQFHIMMKLIANPYIFDNFSTADSTPTFNKGIRMVKGLNFMNKETTDKGCWETDSVKDGGTDKGPFCSNNDDSHFVSYVNANNSNDDYAGFYNHWYKRTDNTTSTDYWELLFACTTRVLDKKICGAVDDPSPNSTAISGFF